MKHLHIVLTGFSVALLSFACSPPEAQPAFAIDLRIAPTPPTVGPARVLVQLSGTNGGHVGEAIVTVRAAPRAAAQDSVTYTTISEGSGRYSVKALPFTAPGDWILTVLVQQEAGPLETREFPTLVVPRFEPL